MTRTNALLSMLGLVLCVVGFLCFKVVDLSGNVSREQAVLASAVKQIQNGRKAATKINCAVLSGVSEAGRIVITASTAGPDTPFTRALEKLGYPSLSKRRDASAAAAKAYVNGIASRVVATAGVRHVRIVKPDGTVDCQAFLRLANVKP